MTTVYNAHEYTLNPHLENFNNIFSFLNDVHGHYPQAVSLAAGMPDESLFNLEYHLSAFETYAQYAADRSADTASTAVNTIGQYCSSKGIINTLLARYLQQDENIHAEAENILVTLGAQEALATILFTVCDREKDVVLMESPGYVGLSAIAQMAGYRVEGVKMDTDGLDLTALETAIQAQRDAGREVKLVYTIPDHHNPSGYSMSANKRKRLLELAAVYNFLIVEDAVYNGFSYTGQRQPSLKSTDQQQRVIYVGSFSKSLFPGLRIGFIVADQLLQATNGRVVPLSGELEKVKAQLTNNTPTICQAILGGILIREQFSLRQITLPKLEVYGRKRDVMLSALEQYIGAHQPGWADGISWNRPDGGFFIKLTLPFTIDADDVQNCAGKFGVIFCPMSSFYLHPQPCNEIRLAFSKGTEAQLETGIRRLAEFLQAKMQQAACSEKSLTSSEIFSLPK